MVNRYLSFASRAVLVMLAARNILPRILMKAATAKKPVIRIAVVESDPLRFVGFRALFD